MPKNTGNEIIAHFTSLWFSCELIHVARYDSMTSLAAVVPVGIIHGMRTGRSNIPIFFPRIDDSHFNMFHTSLTAVRCFEDGNVGKQLGRNIYCMEY